MALNVFIQVAVMFIIMSIGILCYKKKMISENTGAELSKFLLMIVNPCVILHAFQIEYKPELLNGLVISAILAVVSNTLGVIIATLFIRKNPERKEYIVERFAIVFSNCGFMGIPLIQAVVGDIGVFYASTYVAVFNLFTWTYGVSIMKGKMSLKDIIKVLTSAPIISIVVGILIFIFSVKLPLVIAKPIEFISSLNTPLAMIVTGIYLARTDIKSALKNIRIFAVSALRLIVVPAVMLIVFIFIGAENEIFTSLLIANMIATACPTASSTLMMSRMFERNAEYASMIITVSTLFSILTIPVIMMAFDKVSGMFPLIFFS
ncbi:MAG: AEC family transporter [Oscillospiraceae bacterium]|nr:AEC family transporter [Clostridia bacterium]MBR6695585.1 AEC family transporter [Oscillospiraceae bacterium]